MKKNKTIIISCAGMGRRLGIGVTKALVMIEDKPLIIRHLEMLADCDDIRIVVGYQAEKVIEVVRRYRKDIIFVMNHSYENTGTAGSVSLALENSRDMILTLDGDTIIHPDDMKEILESDDEFIAVTDISSDDPVLVQVENNSVNGFSRKSGVYEWTGVAQLKNNHFKKSLGHVYEGILPYLPLPFKKIRLKEIDTINDYEIAKKWIKNNYKDPYIIGVVGGMGSFATLDFFRRILLTFPAKKEWDRPRIIIDNYCTIPSRVRAILYGENYNEVIQELTASIEGLIRQGANSIILACNTSHYFLNEILKSHPVFKNNVLDMIKICTDKIEELNIHDLYMIASEGTIETNIYKNQFDNKGVNVIYPSKLEQIKIRKFIEAVKTNQITDSIISEFSLFISDIQCENILLGCTEIPIIYEMSKDEISKNKVILDPLECVLSVLKKIK